MDAEKGFYKVMIYGKWEIAKYIGNGEWKLAGLQNLIDENDITAIHCRVSEFPSDENSGLHLHDIIARYSIDEDAEYNIAKLFEYKIRLSDENEDGLTHDEYDEYQELEDWFNGL